MDNESFSVSINYFALLFMINGEVGVVKATMGTNKYQYEGRRSIKKQ